MKRSVGVRKGILGIGLVGAAAALVWSQIGTQPASPASRAKPARGVAKTTPAEALEAYRASLRLPPDQRFQLAFADAYHLVTGKEPQAVTATWKDGQWQLHHGGALAATLPAMPTWSDLFGALVSWASSQNSPPAPAAESGAAAERAPKAAFYASEAVPELVALGREWAAGRRSAEGAERAARILTGLLVQGPDPMHIQDRLAARAAASLAVARALRADAGVETESLLARRFGYGQHAVEVAERLPAQSAVRAYVLGDFREIEKIAHAPGASDEVQHLYLIRLFDADTARWWQEIFAADVAEADQAAVVGSGLAGLTSETAVSVPLTLVALLTSRWLGQQPPERRQQVTWALGLAGDVELAIAASTRASEAGPFVDPGVYAEVAGGLYFNSLVSLLDGTIDRFGYENARRMLDANAFPERRDRPGGRVTTLRRYWVRRIQLAEGALDRLGDTAQAAALERDLSVHQRARFLADQNSGMNTDRGLIDARRMAREYLATLDSNLCNRESAIRVVNWRLLDRAAASSLERVLVRDDGVRRRELQNRVRARDGDLGGLWADVESRELSPYDRALALYELAQRPGVDAARVRATCEAFWKQPALRRDFFRTCDWFLGEVSHDYAAAARIAREFIRDPASKGGSRRSDALAKLADALIQDGKAASAWKLLEPELENEVGAVFTQGIRALIALQRFDEAAALVATAEQRYPGYYFSWLAEIYWRKGESNKAARVLAHRAHEYRYGGNTAEAFEAAYRGKSAEDVLQAFDELVQVSGTKAHRGYFTDMADLFLQGGRFDVAFELYWRLARYRNGAIKNASASPDGGSDPIALDPGDAFFLARAWDARRQLRGAEDADAWLRGLMPSGFGPAFAVPFHDAGYPQLLWAAYPQPDARPAIWKMRAIAAALDASVMAEHGAALRARFSPAANADLDTGLARLALGLDPEAQWLERPLAKPELCRVAFHLGAAAESRGDLAKASEWYQVSVSTDAYPEFEHGLAVGRLDKFRSDDPPFPGYGATQPRAP